MDVIDAALCDTVSKFPVDIQPFRDMIDGMRMDLVKPRYQTFDELYEYWILGRIEASPPPRWSVLRNVLGFGADDPVGEQ